MMYGNWLNDVTPEEIEKILNNKLTDATPDKYWGRVYTNSVVGGSSYFRETETKFRSIEIDKDSESFEVIPTVNNGKEMIFIEGKQLIEIKNYFYENTKA